MPDNQTSEEILAQLREVASMVMQAATANTMEQMLQNIANTARELIGARYAALGIPDYKGGLQFFKVSGMKPHEIEKIDHPPVGLGLLGHVMREAHNLRLEEMASHPAAVGFPEGHPHMEKFMGVPIKLGDQLHGIFYLTDKLNDKPFSKDDEWLLEIMSGYVALAIADKHLQDQRSQITLMREREQIGMSLHDGVIQSIYALGMRLDIARRRGPLGDEEVDDTLGGLNNIIDEIRDAIFQLQEDTTVDRLNLRRRFQRVLSQLYVPASLNVSLSLPPHVIPMEAKKLDSLEMMVNECLSNVIRHAEASYVRLAAIDSATHITVSIEDDGIGFDPNNLDYQTGLGLRNLERRTRMQGGQLNIHSTPGTGTKVEIRLPLD